MPVDILAFGAHPDDIEISMGGTLLKYAAQGKRLAIVDLTKGENGTRGSAELRLQESELAAKKLGLVGRVNLGLADGFFEENQDSIMAIIQEIRHFQAQIVFANSTIDRHPDHARAAKLVERACFLSGLPKIKTFKDGQEQQAFRPKLVLHYIQDYYIKPDFVLDVSDFMDAKIDLIQSFSSQFYDPQSDETETPISGQEFFDFIKGRMMDLGRPTGAKYAEGFTANRTLGVESLFDLL